MAPRGPSKAWLAYKNADNFQKARPESAPKKTTRQKNPTQAVTWAFTRPSRAVTASGTRIVNGAASLKTRQLKPATVKRKMRKNPDPDRHNAAPVYVNGRQVH